MREKELTLTNEDARKNENKNGEKLKNLENLLDNVNQVSIKIIVLIFNFKDIFGILYTKIFLPNLAKLYFSLSINQVAYGMTYNPKFYYLFNRKNLI